MSSISSCWQAHARALLELAVLSLAHMLEWASLSAHAVPSACSSLPLLAHVLLLAAVDACLSLLLLAAVGVRAHACPAWRMLEFVILSAWSSLLQLVHAVAAHAQALADTCHRRRNCWILLLLAGGVYQDALGRVHWQL